MNIEVCPTCEYLYRPNISGDLVVHRKYHDEFLNGVRAKELQSDIVVDNSGGFKIILVSPTSSAWQRKRAERVAKYSKIDADDFDSASYYADDKEQKDFPLIFIGIKDNRVIALLVLRKTKCVCKITWAEYEKREKNSWSLRKQWGIAMIWTLASQRRKGYAGQLINASSKYVDNSIFEMAWFTPFTKVGYSLAKSLSPREINLTM